MPTERHHSLRAVIKKSEHEALYEARQSLSACAHRQAKPKGRPVSRETLTCPAGRNKELRVVAIVVLFPQPISDHLQLQALSA